MSEEKILNLTLAYSLAYLNPLLPQHKQYRKVWHSPSPPGNHGLGKVTLPCKGWGLFILIHHDFILYQNLHDELTNDDVFSVETIN